ncbi:MAG: hypothetical protein IJK83_05705, partial [Clostridiales bacterium]|nr:hypothetical protein [Clostridiales bacterium]
DGSRIERQMQRIDEEEVELTCQIHHLRNDAPEEQSEAKMHPKSRKRAIWDTFSPSKTPQIFEITTLGYKSDHKCIPNYKNRPFWDTFSPSKPPQIEKTSSLGYIYPLKTTPKNIISPFGIFLALPSPKTHSPHSVDPVSTVRCLILFMAEYTMSLKSGKAC